MTPPEHEIGIPGGSPHRLRPELALRTSRDFTSGSEPEIAASSSSTFIRPRKSLSNSETRLPLASDSSSLLKPRSSSEFYSQSQDPSSVSSRGPSPSVSVNDINENCERIIVRSFAPRVAVFASSDTEEFVREKGFRDGLHSLLRPYGERLHGKVIIRDSIGGSRAWDDFGIRFIDSQMLQEDNAHRADGVLVGQDARNLANGPQRASQQSTSSYSDETGISINRALDYHLRTTSAVSDSHEKGRLEFKGATYKPRPRPSSTYQVYLRKILSSASIVPYETFSHPVTCLIAVSSRHPAPIEALRQLYSSTSHGGKKIPAWMGTEYLRYYVLIHDEENDDITKSTALFDLMKRHFGLHCHLLRLRQSQCVLTDDDSTRVPSCEWLSAQDQVENSPLKDHADEIELSEKYILESDLTAIRTFLREMVVQSIVPFMESKIVTWNDQVASRRRGIGGRFMSFSKRWTGFGAPKNTVPGLAGISNPSGSNYDSQHGFYPPETPESTMRRLGDYAFMLRDWKLAYTTYDFLRADFGHDKAWAYHAAANEMAAITSMLSPNPFNSKSRAEILDQMLECAAYSYLTRCSMPSNAIRCLTIATELLITRGPNAVEDAARWGAKLLEISVLTPSAQALTTERIAECYMLRTRAHSTTAGIYKRQAALWSLFASTSWLRLDKPDQARVHLREASVLYGFDKQDSARLPFPSMQDLWQRLDLALRDASEDKYAALNDTSVAPEDIQSATVGKSVRLNEFIRSSVPDAEGFINQDAGHAHPPSFDDQQLQNDGFE